MTIIPMPLAPAPAEPLLDPIADLMPAGSICTLAGASGVGKTALYASWIRRWFDGKTICGHRTNSPKQIGILVGDRRWQSHRQWLDVAGVADDPRLSHYSLRDDDHFPWNDLRLWPKVKDLFSRALDKLKLEPGATLIVDPMPIWIPGKVNDYKDVAIGIGTLDHVLKPRGISTLAVFHQSKQIADKSQQYKRPQDRILGSAAQIGFSDTAMYLLGPEDLDTSYYGFGAVPHNSKSETWKFTRDAWGMFVPYTAPEDHGSLETVFEHIPQDVYGCKVSQLQHQLKLHGFDLVERTIYRCLVKLVEDGRVVNPKRGQYLRRPVS